MLSVVWVCCCGRGCGHHLQLQEWLQYQLSSPKHPRIHQLEPKLNGLRQFQLHIQRFVLLFISFLYYSDQHALNQQLWRDPEDDDDVWRSAAHSGLSLDLIQILSSLRRPLIPACSNSTPSNLQPSKMMFFLLTESAWFRPVRLRYKALWSVMAEIG